MRELTTFRTSCRAAVAAIVGATALASPSAGLAAPPFQTAFIDYPMSAFEGQQADAGFGRVGGAGARVVKLSLDWGAAAPRGRPANPADPADPAYDWTSIDTRIRAARRHGLEPLVMITRAPPWASGTTGWNRPDVAELALFARAAATRYSGTFSPPLHELPPPEATLPRARYWQVWNEPNLEGFLSPQYRGGRLVSADTYRAMVNRFSAAVKAVNPANRVLAGGTAPFRSSHLANSAPLTFMRAFLCLRANLTAKPNCGPVRFDIWGHHPYTSGDPRHSAQAANDVSLGDLPEMRRVLRAAAAKRKIASNGSVRFWIDEFSWDTNPPDPRGVPSRLHARWVAEGFYRMWKSGVTLVAWLQLMDNRWRGVCGDPYQSGLYFWSPSIATAKPKYSLAAFRFPFVAIRENKRIVLWGRTPGSNAARVAIQRKVGARWRSIAVIRAGGNGVFQKRLAQPWRTGQMRAKIGNAASIPFALNAPRDRWINPFGTHPMPGQCG